MRRPLTITPYNLLVCPKSSESWNPGTLGLSISQRSRNVIKRLDPSIQWCKRVENWQNLHAGRGGLTADQVSRGWKYAIADVVATLQLGLVQWVRQDGIVMLEPSRNQINKYERDLGMCRRHGMDEPKYPKPYQICPFRAPICPAELALRRQLCAAWGHKAARTTR